MFVVGGKIQKFLRESILDPKVSRETCWRCCTRENVRMLGILLGLNPARFKVEQAFILEEFGMQQKQSASSTALAPEGRIGRPTCTPGCTGQYRDCRRRAGLQ